MKNPKDVTLRVMESANLKQLAAPGCSKLSLRKTSSGTSQGSPDQNAGSLGAHGVPLAISEGIPSLIVG